LDTLILVDVVLSLELTLPSFWLPMAKCAGQPSHGTNSTSVLSLRRSRIPMRSYEYISECLFFVLSCILSLSDGRLNLIVEPFELPSFVQHLSREVQRAATVAPWDWEIWDPLQCWWRGWPLFKS
jgi:hypothetical protein